jgi:hypothetical protein
MLNYFELVLIKGHKDTRVKSGQSYDTITLAEIAQMARCRGAAGRGTAGTAHSRGPSLR